MYVLKCLLWGTSDKGYLYGREVWSLLGVKGLTLKALMKRTHDTRPYQMCHFNISFNGTKITCVSYARCSNDYLV